MTRLVLTRDQEIDAISRYKAGDGNALAPLIESHRPLVVKTVSEVSKRRDLYPDLISEGVAGLIIAAGRFDETKNVRFISYALFWAKARIIKFAFMQSADVSLSEADRYLVILIRRQLKHGDEIDCAQLMEKIRATTEDRVESVISALVPAKRLDSQSYADGESIGQRFYSADDELQDAELIRKDSLQAIERVMQSLPAREQHVVYGRYFAERSLGSVGSDLGLTKERVRQIEAMALAKIRKKLRIAGAADLIKIDSGISKRAKASSSNAAKTHCPRGHAYAGENVFIDRRGFRRCRECTRKRSRQRQRDLFGWKSDARQKPALTGC